MKLPSFLDLSPAAPQEDMVPSFFNQPPAAAPQQGGPSFFHQPPAAAQETRFVMLPNNETRFVLPAGSSRPVLFTGQAPPSVGVPQGGSTGLVSSDPGSWTVATRPDPATWVMRELIAKSQAADLRIDDVYDYTTARCREGNESGADSAQIMLCVQAEIEQAIRVAPRESQKVAIRSEMDRAVADLKLELKSTALLASAAALRNRTIGGQVKVSTSKVALKRASVQHDRATLQHDKALDDFKRKAEAMIADRERADQMQQVDQAQKDATLGFKRARVELTDAKKLGAEYRKEVQDGKNQTWWQRAQQATSDAAASLRDWAASQLARDEDPAEEGAACPLPGAAAGPAGPS